MQHNPERLPFEGIGARLRGLLASAALERQQAEELRRRLDDAIAELIDIRDEIDAEDEDLEDDEGQCPDPHFLRHLAEGPPCYSLAHTDPTDADWEPTLGWPEGMCQRDLRRGSWLGNAYCPDGEAEPSLGSLGGCYNTAWPQSQWAGGNRDDLEDEHDGREPDRGLLTVAEWRRNVRAGRVSIPGSYEPIGMWRAAR